MNKNAIIVYRMAWGKCALMALSGAIIAWTTSMAGVKWTDLDGTDRVGVLLGCVGAMITVIIAFLDRTISKIEGEQEQIPGTPENIAAANQPTATANTQDALDTRTKVLLNAGIIPPRDGPENKA